MRGSWQRLLSIALMLASLMTALGGAGASRAAVMPGATTARIHHCALVGGEHIPQPSGDEDRDACCLLCGVCSCAVAVGSAPTAPIFIRSPSAEHRYRAAASIPPPLRAAAQAHRARAPPVLL
jgi:hypothetical protein